MRTPFKFLDAYTQADKDIFFGRDAEIEELYARSLQGRLVLVYGPSGVGKTSLIQCGLANKFAPADWLPVTVRHGGDVFAALDRALAALAQTKMPPAAPLGEKLHSLYLDYFKPVTLIFDQFEELFIFGTAPERERLATEIAALLAASFKLRIILVIREEYLAELTALEPFLPDVFTNRVRVERMSRANASHAIAGPCHACGVGVEEGLAEQILARLGASKTGAVELTYLQVLLDKLYARSLSQFPSSEGLGVGSELRLTIADLDALGDLSDILGAFLNEQLAALKADAALGEAVLKTLITSDGTKKAMSTAEIIADLSSFGMHGNTGQIPALLNHFVSVRILSEKEEAGRYELRHDSLAQKIFERLTALEKDLLEVVQTLENRYKEYARRGTLLDHAALTYVAPYESRLRFNPQLIGFISLSRQTLTSARRKRLIAIFAALIAILVVVSGLGVFSYLKYRDAEKERKLAEQQAQIAEKQRQKAEQQTEIAQKNLQETQALMAGMQLTATSFMIHDNIDAAITVFQNLLKIKPDHSEAWYYMGIALAQQGKLDEALTVYQRQVEVNPDHPNAWFNIGYILAQQGKLDEAIAAYRKQVKVNPDDKGAWNNMGNVLAKQGKRDEAIAAFRKQVEVKPDDAEAWNGMGLILEQQGKLDEAIAAFQKQVEVKPDHAWVWYHMGFALSQQGKLDEALTAYRKQVEVKPDHAEAWHNIGVILSQQGKLDEAIASFRKQVEVKPDHVEAWNGMGLILEQQGKLDEAIAAFRKQIEVTPDHADAWNNMGNALTHQGKLDEALTAFRKQVEVMPNHANAWNNMGNAFWKQGKLDEALTAFRKQVEVMPNHANAWHNMGVTFAQQGKLDEALTAYRKQVEVKPDHAVAWNNMGGIFWEQGKLDEAANAHANALKVSPNDLNFLSNDIELALIQGDISRFQSRLAAALPLVKPDNYLFAILPFYAWLANPAQGWEPVLATIKQVSPGVKVTWNFATSAPILARQDAATRQAAQHFIAFFEGQIDLPTLQVRLAEQEKRE